MLCIIGDLHIEALERYIPDSHKQILSTFNKVVDREVKNGCSAIIQLGDSFDSPYPDQHYNIAYIKALKRNPEIPKHILMGNHEWADVTTNALKAIHYLCKIGFINGKVYRKPEIVSIDDEKYFFCPHPYVVDQPKKVRYSFSHFGYDGAKGDNGYTLKSKDSPAGRWILGDYHTAQKGKNYMYAGSLCQVKWHESPEKYFIRLEETPKLIKVIPDIILDRANIDSKEAMDELDSNVYWSVNISRKVKLEPDWARKYPHIIRHHTEKAASKRAKILMQQVASEDPLAGLKDYLRNEGLSDKEIKRGYQFLGRKYDG